MITVNKQLAIDLRQRGLTYEEIADQLGCSFAWCAKNLPKIQKGELKIERVVVDGTKQSAIEILEDALKKVREL